MNGLRTESFTRTIVLYKAQPHHRRAVQGTPQTRGNSDMIAHKTRTVTVTATRACLDRRMKACVGRVHVNNSQASMRSNHRHCCATIVCNIRRA
jgi:hypothetical protein